MIVYVSEPLAVTVAGPVLVIDRSAWADPIVVVADAVLLAVFGSGSLPFTVAVLVMVPAVAGAVALMVIVTVAPTARLPTVQVTVPDACVQVPWVDDADTKVTPAGRVSVTPTPVAGLGPLSVATTVYVMVLLIWAVAGPILVMDMSAVPVPWIWVTADAWLLAVFGSNSLPATTAVLVIEPGEAGAVTLMVIVAVAPTARLPTV